MRTFLDVPYRQKDEARSLGARWDAEARKWYVPHGVDLVAFRSWLPMSASPEASTALATPEMLAPTALEAVKGVALSALLAGVARAVAATYQEGVWVRVEVMRVDARAGNVYLELSERSQQGDVHATAKGFIPRGVAQRILPAFERDAGVTLGPGLKLLVRAKPSFSVRWGLSLDIEALDASFTLGDMAARLREIRGRLQREGLFDRNRTLKAPRDFTRVLVVSPADAAGLGDFRADADRLDRHGLCQFVYAHSRFQGEGSAQEIASVAAKKLDKLIAEGTLPDAVVIIRGGGAVNDLAWLNDYALARFVCECPVPVFSGIGHERDNTILDEVANTPFDTPSKVIAHIRDAIVAGARLAQESFSLVVRSAQATIAARLESTHRLYEVSVSGSMRVLQAARAEALRHWTDVQSEAGRHVGAARERAPLLWVDVCSGAQRAVMGARADAARTHAQSVQHIALRIAHARNAADAAMEHVNIGASTMVQRARDTSSALLREILGQGPERTLARGFAIARDDAGQPVTSAGRAAASRSLHVQFADGTVATQVVTAAVTKSTGPQRSS
jgi:exodeoxyribonuclease VII large subunit